MGIRLAVQLTEGFPAMLAHARSVSAWKLFLCLPFLVAQTASADTLRVDDGNQTGVENGSALRPYATIQAALEAAVSGETVLVAAGTYAENIVISDKRLELRGGYAGGTSAGYQSNTPGNFDTQNASDNVTRIDGDDTVATVLLVLTNATGSTVDGFTISGGTRGIELDTEFTFPHIQNVTISNNVVEDNGVADYEQRGGGILLNGDGHLVRDNIIRNNVSGRGAGIALFGENITIAENLIEDNTGYSDHGGGVYQGGTALIRDNLIRGNRTGEELGYGWGGGVIILGVATMRGNVITNNFAPSIGGGIFADEGGDMTLENELIYGNSANLGAAIYVDGGGDTISSNADIINCTIANNTALDSETAKAIFVEAQSTANLVNCIVWGNGGNDLGAISNSVITATYCLIEQSFAGTGNFSAPPLFANPGAGDFHLRSTGGRFDPAANGGAGAFVIDASHSPAIDSGNPASPFNLETSPNGGRVNLGAYGNTPEASRSQEGGEGEGAEEGEGEGEGSIEGEGSADGEGEEEGEGSPDGEGEPDGEDLEMFRQLLYTYASAETSGDGRLTLTEVQAQLTGFTQEQFDIADANNDNLLSVAELLEQTGGGILMSADMNGDFLLTLSELLRLIQLYNAGRYYCAASAGASEDGYQVAAPASEPDCVPHSADRDGGKAVSLSELLRSVQFFNLGGYFYCGDQSPEDGFCEN